MAKTVIKLLPFDVPHLVYPAANVGSRSEGFIPKKGIPLSDLDGETLEEMCSEFRANVFKQAGITEVVEMETYIYPGD